jgi:dTDP-glucose pyrophosphorylase
VSQATTLVLCGGPINYSSLPIGTNASNAMVPVNGKPVIAWILDDLMAKGIRDVTIVVREQDHRLQSLVQRVFSSRMALKLALLKQEGTIVQSLEAGLRHSPASGLVRIILGDTLIRDGYDGDEDFVYVRSVEESRRWCLAVIGGGSRIIDYLDKQENVPSPRLALTGYYHLLNGPHLEACVKRSVTNGERELSDVLRRYGAACPIQARTAEQWFDFGNIDNLVDARRRLLQSRFFNSLTVNPVLNTITKLSEHQEKLRDELAWYLDIPDPLKVLGPRIISHQEVDGRLQVVQEYYGYPTLAELYLYGDMHADTWASILRHIMRIHQELRRHPGRVDGSAVRSMYMDKTWLRLGQLCDQEPAWRDLIEQPSVWFNGRQLRNVRKLEAVLQDRVERMIETTHACVIHGDFCFSNILFDIGHQIIRLIDPRGSFGPKGIYGDARYDIAKLRHSVCGLYDYIVADMFELEEADGRFSSTLFVNGTPRMVGAMFDRLVVEAGYDLDEIRLIEGLLFISMIPLHQGHPSRQRLMFLTGLALLNEVL